MMCKSGLSDIVVTLDEESPMANSRSLLRLSGIFLANPESTIICGLDD